MENRWYKTQMSPQILRGHCYVENNCEKEKTGSVLQEARSVRNALLFCVKNQRKLVNNQTILTRSETIMNKRIFKERIQGSLAFVLAFALNTPKQNYRVELIAAYTTDSEDSIYTIPGTSGKKTGLYRMPVKSLILNRMFLRSL